MRRSLSLFVALLPVLSFTATAGTWQQAALPFENAVISALAGAPSQAGRVYAGLIGYGVIRTDDRGLTWSGAGTGFPLDSKPTALEVGADPDLVFAGTQAGEIFRSTDAGATWTEISPSADARIVCDIVLHTGNPSLLHAGFQLGSELGVHRSTDGGTTWTLASLGAVGVLSLAAQPGNPDVLLAGTPGGASRSTDSGLTWSAMGPSAWYRSLVFSLADPNRVFGVANGDVWRSVDAGAEFGPVGTLPSEWYGAIAVACHPLDADVLVAAGSGYGCNPLNGDFPYGWRSTNAGDTWTITDVTSSCDAGGHTSLAFDPLSPSHLYRGTLGKQGKGFGLSTDVGSTWETRVAGLHNYGVAAVSGDAAGTTYALRLDTFYRSVGDPLTWSQRGSSIGPGHVSEGLEVNTANPNVLHEVGYWGTELLENFAVRSDDGAMVWTEPYMVAGLPPGQVTLWSSHGDGQHVYAPSYGELYRSDDGHASYSLVHPDVHYAARIVVDPGDWQRLFATGAAGAIVGLSTDGGTTFAPRDAGLPAVDPWRVAALFMRRTDPEDLVIVYRTGDVFGTENGGVSWSHRYTLDVSGPPLYESIDVTWDPATRHVFLALRGLGVVTAHPSYQAAGLPTSGVTSVHFSPALATLLVATSSRGIWIQDIAPPTSVGPAIERVPGSLTVAPNPFSGRTVISLAGREGQPRIPLTIVDVTGRAVKRLEMGGGRVLWDGTDAAGRRLPSGVYFIRAPGAGARRVLILR